MTKKSNKKNTSSGERSSTIATLKDEVEPNSRLLKLEVSTIVDKKSIKSDNSLSLTESSNNEIQDDSDNSNSSLLITQADEYYESTSTTSLVTVNKFELYYDDSSSSDEDIEKLFDNPNSTEIKKL